MSRILGHFGADISPHELRAAAQRTNGPPPQDGGLLRRGPGWALTGSATASARSVTAAFDGEIDNRLALLTRLDMHGLAVAERDDSSVLRAAYELDGTAFPEHLSGSYTAAVVDERSAPVLVLAADDAGTIPLYYHWDPGRERLCFASEIPALLTLLRDRPALWEPGLDAYLTTGAPLDGRTMIDGVRVLLPGTTAVCSRGRGLRLIRRTPGPGRTIPAPGPATGVRTRDALGRQPRRRVPGRGPACVLDFGGPGARLAADLTDASGPGLPSVSLDTPGGPGTPGGTPVSLDTSGGLGAPGLPGGGHPAGFEPDHLRGLAWRLGQPDAAPAALTGYALFGAARRAGFRTALATDPLDEIITGRARVEAAVDAADGGWLARYADALATIPAVTRSRLYSADYRAFLADRGDAARELTARLGGEASPAARREVLTGFELEVLLPARGLRRLAHLSAPHSVRARLPLAPREAWAAAAGHAVSPPVHPATALLTRDGPLTGFVLDVLSPARLRTSGLFDPTAVRRLLAAQLNRPGERRAAALWSLLMFELWREEYGITAPSVARLPRRAMDPADLPALSRRTVAF